MGCRGVGAVVTGMTDETAIVIYAKFPLNIATTSSCIGPLLDMPLPP